jgi:hypothetical protein
MCRQDAGEKRRALVIAMLPSGLRQLGGTEFGSNGFASAVQGIA